MIRVTLNPTLEKCEEKLRTLDREAAFRSRAQQGQQHDAAAVGSSATSFSALMMYLHGGVARASA
jgi:hypothetical protein